jgi:hypothetical protein
VRMCLPHWGITTCEGGGGGGGGGRGRVGVIMYLLLVIESVQDGAGALILV